MRQIDRRQMIAGSAAILANSVSALAAVADWTPASPSELEFSPDLERRLDDFIRSGRASNLHGVLIARRGRMVFERYYEGDDVVRDSGGRAVPTRVAFTAGARTNCAQ
jgi:hypothetical protein